MLDSALLFVRKMQTVMKVKNAVETAQDHALHQSNKLTDIFECLCLHRHFSGRFA